METDEEYCVSLVRDLITDVLVPLRRHDKKEGTNLTRTMELVYEFLGYYHTYDKDATLRLFRKSINQRYHDLLSKHDESLFTTIPESTPKIELDTRARKAVSLISTMKNDDDRKLIDNIVNNLSFSYIVSVIREPVLRTFTSGEKEIVWRYTDELLRLM